MRPRHIAAENVAGNYVVFVKITRFNEAAAYSRGKLDAKALEVAPAIEALQ